MTGPSYSKEYLSELKASTPSTPSNPKPNDSYDAELSFDGSEISGALVVNDSADLEAGELFLLNSTGISIVLRSGYPVGIVHPGREAEA